MTRPSDHYPRRCGCGHHAADPAINDHPISLRDDLDALKAEIASLRAEVAALKEQATKKAAKKD